MNKKLLLVSIILVVLANLIVWGFVVYKAQSINKDHRQSLHNKYGLDIVKIKLPYFNIVNENGSSISPDFLDSKLNILIFFTLEDCPACLYEAEVWSEASQVFSKSDISFWGVVPEDSKKSIPEFIKEYKISFPIIYDNKNGLKKTILSIDRILELGIGTPFKLYINNKQEIICIEGSQKHIEEQRRFLERVQDILRILE
jgi:peroxiredoxin